MVPRPEQQQSPGVNNNNYQSSSYLNHTTTVTMPPTDPFASFGQAPVSPQQNVVYQQQSQQKQQSIAVNNMQAQPPMQGAPMQTPAAPMSMMQQPPVQTQPVMMQQAPVAPHMAMQPQMQMMPPIQQLQYQPQPQPLAQPAIPQEQSTPPPMTINAVNQSPPSPLGDMSVLAQAANAAAAQLAPTIPTAANTGVVPLQPIPQSAPMPMQSAPAPVLTQPVVQQTAPVVQAANPFDSFGAAPTQPTQFAPPPAMAPPRAPPTPPQQEQQQPTSVTQHVMQQQHQVPVQQATTISPPMSPVPPNSFMPQNQYHADPFGYAFSPFTSPVTSPVTSPGGSPNGSPQGSPGAMVPSAAMNNDPFGVFGGGGLQQPAAPFASSSGGGALVTSAPPVSDPFGLFGSTSPPAPAPQAPPPAQTGHMFSPPEEQKPTSPLEEDPWAAAGFGQAAQPDPSATQPASSNAAAPAYNQSNRTIDGTKQPDKPLTLDPTNNLPTDGEYYEARINARSLGTMFYTARNLEDTLYVKMANNVIETLNSRPVVAYVAENSAAHNAGVQVGHVILSVNGQDITDPEKCANFIRTAPRPMSIRVYVPPELELTISEGRHLVKYDTKDLEAPKSGIEWKRKYVVVGGIVAKPYTMNMFYNKKDYDTAVKEAHAGRKISVKVKQFDLRGARIVLKGKDGKPNWVDYQTERKPWYYITILPHKGYPIKISSLSLEELEPVYAAVRRCIRKDMEDRHGRRMEQFENTGLGGGGSGRSSPRNSGSTSAYSPRNSPGSGHFSSGTDFHGPNNGNGSGGGFEGFGDRVPDNAGSYWNNQSYVK